MILKSVISLRSFKHEFPRFEKKHDPWSDPTHKNTPTPELTIKDDFLFLSRDNPRGFSKNELISSIFNGKCWQDSFSSFVTLVHFRHLMHLDMNLVVAVCPNIWNL